MGIQPTATAGDILEESSRVMLEEFKKPATRKNSKYKSLITWAAKTIKDAFTAAGKSVSCRSRAADVLEAAVLQPSTQLRERVAGRAEVGRQGTRWNRQATQKQLAALRQRQRGGEAGPSQPQEQQTQSTAQYGTQLDVPLQFQYQFASQVTDSPGFQMGGHPGAGTSSSGQPDMYFAATPSYSQDLDQTQTLQQIS